MATFTATKDPEAVLDYAFDWSAWLAEDETVASQDVTATGVTVESDSTDGRIVSVRLSGGVAGRRASVKCEVTTSRGQTDQRTLTVYVVDR